MGFIQAIIPLKNILCKLYWVSDQAFYAAYLVICEPQIAEMVPYYGFSDLPVI